MLKFGNVNWLLNESLCLCISGGDRSGKNYTSTGDMLDVMTQQLLLSSYVCVLLFVWF